MKFFLLIAACSAAFLNPAFGQQHQTRPAFSPQTICSLVRNSFFQRWLFFPDIPIGCEKGPPQDGTPSIHKKLHNKLIFDNDFFAVVDGKASGDSNYTQGFRYETFFFGGAVPSREFSSSPNSADTERFYFGWDFGQEIYTPEDITKTTAPIDDRPYAAVLYLGVFAEKYFENEGYTKVGLDLAILGPLAGGKASQAGVHTLNNSTLPRGWKNQISGEMGVIYRFEIVPIVYCGFFDLCQRGEKRHFDIAPKIKGKIGNLFTDFSVEGTFRVGLLEPYFNTGFAGIPWHAQFHFFGRSEIRAVLYNATIEGGLINQQPENKGSDNIRHLYTENELGFSLKFSKFSFDYGLVYQSPEIEEKEFAYNFHSFGRLVFSSRF